jgi:hypothetical protein
VYGPQGQEVIRKARSPLAAKEIAHGQFESAKRPDWGSVKVNVMALILRKKLEQHQEVRNALMRSGDEKIVEDSPTDDFWGRGEDGGGQNQLGKLWMQIRRGVR